MKKIEKNHEKVERVFPEHRILLFATKSAKRNAMILGKKSKNTVFWPKTRKRGSKTQFLDPENLKFCQDGFGYGVLVKNRPPFLTIFGQKMGRNRWKTRKSHFFDKKVTKNQFFKFCQDGFGYGVLAKKWPPRVIFRRKLEKKGVKNPVFGPRKSQILPRWVRLWHSRQKSTPLFDHFWGQKCQKMGRNRGKVGKRPHPPGGGGGIYKSMSFSIFRRRKIRVRISSRMP